MKAILIVEDNPADALLIRQSFTNAALPSDYELVFAEDGEEALEKLAQLRAEPLQLILLDLNLPKSGGIEILQTIRADPALAMTLVVTWTSSLAPEEAQRLFELGVDQHIVKPMHLEEYTAIGTRIRDLLVGRQTCA